MHKQNLSKKVICFAITFFASLSINTVFAQHNIGDVIAHTVDTDIITYVNNIPIPSYSVDGETLVRLEDLQYYGFNISFDNNIASAVYDENKTVAPIDRKADSGLSVLYSDITVQINGITVPGYNIEGYMAVPVERACETYLQTNAENIYSEYSMNYQWNGNDKSLRLDMASDRIAYQDLMLDLLRAAKMDFDSNFYKHYVEPKETKRTEDPAERSYYEKFKTIEDPAAKISDISGTKLEQYALLISKADMIDINDYDNDPIYPYRGSTVTDAAFLISRILGCPADYGDAFDYFRDTRVDFRYTENNVIDLYDYSDYTITASDASAIPDWARGYFSYLLDIGVFDTDSAGYLYPNAFLTKESEEQLINAMLKYMERGITDMDINFMLYRRYSPSEPITLSPHKLTSPAQIIDDVLYIPFYSIFNETYGDEIKNFNGYDVSCNAFKYLPSDKIYIPEFEPCGAIHTFTNHYIYIGDGGLFFDIFPGINKFVDHIPFQGTGGMLVPNYRKFDYPIQKLYGEPMLAIYNYHTNQKADLSTLLTDFDFDPDSNTFSFSYRQYF